MVKRLKFTPKLSCNILTFTEEKMWYLITVLYIKPEPSILAKLYQMLIIECLK